MKKFKIGEVYRVGSDGAEKGNSIRILGVCGTPGGGTDYLYETIQGMGPQYSGFYFSSDFARGLELVESERKIVITTDGKTTTAKLYDGRETIREAKAVCSDSDTFDFNIGAGIALARLTGRPFLGVDLPQPEYNPDDVRLPKPKTLRDVVAEREPDKIDPSSGGGVKGCPHHCDYLGVNNPTQRCPRGKDGKALTCSQCWDRPYTPNEEAKPEPPKPKTLRDVVAEREPDKINPDELGGVHGCPRHCEYLREVVNDSPSVCPSDADGKYLSCRACWDRPYTPKEEAKQGRENLVSPELKQQLLNEFKDAYTRTLSVVTKIRATTNEKTGGNNNE